MDVAATTVHTLGLLACILAPVVYVHAVVMRVVLNTRTDAPW